MKRKYGHPMYNMKILLPNTRLRICNNCGQDHEVGHLCRKWMMAIERWIGWLKRWFFLLAAHCYEKVKEETRQMSEKITETLGLNPVDQEVVVLYDGEKNEKVRSKLWRCLWTSIDWFDFLLISRLISNLNSGKASGLSKWTSLVRCGSAKISCRKQHSNRPKRKKSNQPIWDEFFDFNYWTSIVPHSI